MAFDLKVGGGNRWSRVGRQIFGWTLRPPRGTQAATRRYERGGDAWLRSVIERAQEEAGKGVLPRIAGMLTGFIDLTFRVGDRYFVPTTRPIVSRPSARSVTCVGHYNQAWMAWEMAHHGYHRCSTLWRSTDSQLGSGGYDYDTHIGGHFYLFVRGMTGPKASRDKGLCQGVYFDRWPKEVVEGIDRALYGGESATP